MGSLGPFALPNTRRPLEAMFLGTAAPSAFGPVTTLVFGVPAEVVTASLTLEGRGELTASPHVVALASATLEGTGALVASPQGVALASLTLEGRGDVVASPQVVVTAGVTLEGVGQLLASPEVVDVPGVVEAAATLEGASALEVGTVTVRPTLLERLNRKIPGLRATLALKIGDRPYRVYLTTVRWSGGEPGRGDRAATRIELGCGVDKKTGLVQPPKIEATSPLKRPKYVAGPRGLTPSSAETDTIYLTQVDPNLVERDFVTFADLAKDQEAFFEIEHVGLRGGVGAERPVRRYRLAEAPQFDALRMQWVVALRPQEPGKPFGGPRVG